MAFDYLAVLDFEATCDEPATPAPQEIIEFPTVLVDGRTFEVAGEFTAFVRPQHHPTLSDFCTGLTSITQADVDAAAPFTEVFDQHVAWMRAHGLPMEDDETGPDWAFVTCGDWDLAKMLPGQLAACEPPIDHVPAGYTRWINIKVPFQSWAGNKRRAGMAGMLDALDLELIGRQHRGIDDCRNIARIAGALARAGQPLQQTGALSAKRYPPLRLTLVAGSDRHRVVLNKRLLGSLHGLASLTFRREPDSLRDAAGKPLTDARLLRLRQDSEVHIVWRK